MKESNNYKRFKDYTDKEQTVFLLKGCEVVITNVSERWYLNGKLHREDGPAVEWHDGTREWYSNGKEYTEEEFNERLQTV